jgi:hypothetical protein
MKTTGRGLALAVVTFAGAISGCAAGGGAMEAASPAAATGDAKGPPAAYAPPEPMASAAPEAPAAAPREPRYREELPSAKAEEQPSAKMDGEGPRKDRPGLGTEWGESRASSISMVSFDRADPSSPFATASLFYNDEEGARAMSSAGLRRLPAATFDVGGGLVSVGLRDDRGRFYSGFVTGGRDYVVGEAGRRYTIVVKNRTDLRLEVVLSVDGLDVLDGKSASFRKRGYILDPRAELEVDGFRQTLDAVAAFRFGSVRGSYAGEKYGDTRNVGVIGLAVFHEAGSTPWRWTAEEIERRRTANPFPAEFATPPGY